MIKMNLEMHFVVAFLSGFLFGGLFVPMSFLGPYELNNGMIINNKFLKSTLLLFVFVSIIAIGAAITSIDLNLYASYPEQKKELGRYYSFGVYVGLLAIVLVGVITYLFKNRKIDKDKPENKEL